MKRLITFLVMLVAACLLKAQVTTENYIRTRRMTNGTGTSYVDEIAYYDALGRPVQQVWKARQNGGDVNRNRATLVEYDLASRETYRWALTPFGSSTYLAPATFQSTAKSKRGDTQPYIKTVYESSPLARASKTNGPGAAWADHGVSYTYTDNEASGELACKRYTTDGTALSGGSTYYPAGTLRVVKTTDEDGHASYTFTDRLGRLVLTRQMNGSTPHDTYYVYDSRDNLCFVLQPEYQTEADLEKYAFQYKYDGYGRCSEKTLPGAGTVRYDYDSADRVIFSQDGNLNAKNHWTYYEYDDLDRLTEQGECNGKDKSSKTVWVKNYYDNYDFRSQTGFNNSNFPADNTGYGKGYLTGSEVTVPGTTTKLYTAYYYDVKGQVTKTVQSNLQGGYDVTTTSYTFTGQPQTVTHTHTASGKTTLTEVYTYTYDYEDRLTQVQHKLGSTQVTLATYTYDDYGRLASKKLHGSATNQLSYSYNIRDWVTKISSGKFTQDLYYNTGNGTACYNGNISSMTWKAGNESTTRGYKFAYDDLNRLTMATYGEGTSISSNANRFTEKVTNYDKNGNIKALQRYGQTSASAYGLIDNLTFTLDGNRPTRVDDAVSTAAYNNGFEFKDGVKQANEYAYDANGNLTKDLNRGITEIEYNFLNLPDKVVFSDRSTIEYVYAADGTKLRTKHVINGTTTTTDYCGNVIYENGVRKYLLTEEGYVTLADSKYHYYLQDHQGNNRVVVDQSGTVEETNHYYPFGGVFASTSSVQPYKYNGKELDTKKGLNWYDYGARHYDAALGRFITQDAYAEKYPAMSPYQYGANNPVCNIDVNGDSIITTLTLPLGEGLANINYTYKTDAKGNYGFFDPQGNMYSGNNEFMNSLSNALATLREGKTGNALINELMNSENIVNIANRKFTSADPKGKYIAWNPSETIGGIDQNGNRVRPSYIGLGHEMAHIQDIWNGTADYSEWVNGIPNAEKYATHVENQLRAEHNLPLRTHYGIVNGKGDPHTPLLIKGTYGSLYFKKKVTLGGVSVYTTPYIY